MIETIETKRSGMSVDEAREKLAATKALEAFELAMAIFPDDFIIKNVMARKTTCSRTSSIGFTAEKNGLAIKFGFLENNGKIKNTGSWAINSKKSDGIIVLKRLNEMK